MKIPKPQAIAILAASLLTNTCSEEDEGTAFCGSTSFSAPPGYEIVVLSELDGSYKGPQFVDDQNGFLLGTNPKGGYAKIQATSDGGITWTELLKGNSYIPTSLRFRNQLE